ncbi:MAG TPA: DUF2807 domain-containing protein [Pseudomonadales bacterium]
MKTSRRLLFGTFAALLAAPVVLVAYGRISGAGIMYELPAPERPTAEDLAALRDFDTIEVRGDFALEIAGAPEYSVTYTPLTGSRGFLRANVTDGTLTIEGYANRTETTAGTVRITLPELSHVDAESLFMLTVRDFDGEALTLDAAAVRRLIVENNRLGELDVALQAPWNITFRNNEIGTTRMSRLGATATVE